eukprot:gene38957-47389_t
MDNLFRDIDKEVSLSGLSLGPPNHTLQADASEYVPGSSLWGGPDPPHDPHSAPRPSEHTPAVPPSTEHAPYPVHSAPYSDPYARPYPDPHTEKYPEPYPASRRPEPHAPPSYPPAPAHGTYSLPHPYSHPQGGEVQKNQLHVSFVTNKMEELVSHHHIMRLIQTCAPSAYNLVLKQQKVDPRYNSQSGYGFVSFPNLTDCMDCLDRLKHLTIEGVTFDCSLARKIGREDRSVTILPHNPHYPPSYSAPPAYPPRDPYAYAPPRDPYARDPYPRDPYSRDPYPRPYGRDPYARDPYARDPYPPASYARPSRDYPPPSYPRDSRDPRDPYVYPPQYSAPPPAAPAPTAYPRDYPREPYPPQEPYARDPYAYPRDYPPAAQPAHPRDYTPPTRDYAYPAHPSHPSHSAPPAQPAHAAPPASRYSEPYPPLSGVRPASEYDGHPARAGGAPAAWDRDSRLEGVRP